MRASLALLQVYFSLGTLFFVLFALDISWFEGL